MSETKIAAIAEWIGAGQHEAATEALNDLFGGSGVLAPVPDSLLFPFLYFWGLDKDSVARSAKLREVKASESLIRLVDGCWISSPIRLYVAGSLYLNPAGELWSGGPSYFAYASPLGRSIQTTWQPAVVGMGVTLQSVLFPSGQRVVLNGAGQLWSGGPDYWVSSDPLGLRPVVNQFQVTVAGDALLFSIQTPDGTLYLDGYGEARPGGAYKVACRLNEPRSDGVRWQATY